MEEAIINTDYMQAWLGFCHNCGSNVHAGHHFVPRSGEDPGMYACEPNPKRVKELEAALKKKYGVVV
jgi:hypothetical protein